MPAAVPYRSGQSSLELRAGSLWTVLLVPVALCLTSVPRLLSARDHFDRVVLSVSFGFLVTGTVIMLVAQLRLRAMGCLVRLDAEGVTVHGYETVSWADLDEVRWITQGKRKKRTSGDLVVFVARPGFSLPVMPWACHSRNPHRQPTG